MDNSKIRFFKGYWTVQDAKNHPDWLFVYGDNDVHQGIGGQAVVRTQDNSAGIPTKKYPSNHLNSFYNDKELQLNKQKIKNAIDKVIERSVNYRFVVMPENGLGTGLADLPNKAPLTNKYLVDKLEEMKKLI